MSIANGAALTVDSGASLAAGTTLIANGTVNLNNAIQTIATLNGGSTGIVNLNNNTLTVSGGGTFSGKIVDPIGSLTVSGGTLTLSGPNTYSGTTTISSGTLVAGAANTLSASSAVSIAGGTLDVTGYANAVASLNVSSGTLRVGLTNPLTSSGALTLTGGTLAVGGSPTAGSYTLANYASETGAFSSLTGAAGYSLQYGSTALILQHNQDQALSNPSPTPINMIAGAATTVSATLTNTAPSGSAALTIALADNNGTGGLVSALNSSASSPLAAGSSSNITGTFTAGSTLGLGQT